MEVAPVAGFRTDSIRAGMEHPIDGAIRAWLERHVEKGTASALSVAVGHSTSWLHKYINGAGHATIDDLVRLAGLLHGLNMPAITGAQRALLTACQGLDESDLQDVIDYVALRAKRRPPRAASKESSAPTAHTPPATGRKGRGTH